MPCHLGCHDTYREHLLSINIAPSATPSRRGGQQAKEINEREARWQKDMHAYKEMRKTGLWPTRIDGASEVQAKARSQWEVETGHLFETPQESKEALEGLNAARELREEIDAANG